MVAPGASLCPRRADGRPPPVLPAASPCWWGLAVPSSFGSAAPGYFASRFSVSAPGSSVAHLPNPRSPRWPFLAVWRPDPPPLGPDLLGPGLVGPLPRPSRRSGRLVAVACVLCRRLSAAALTACAMCSLLTRVLVGCAVHRRARRGAQGGEAHGWQRQDLRLARSGLASALGLLALAWAVRQCRSSCVGTDRLAGSVVHDGGGCVESMGKAKAMTVSPVGATRRRHSPSSLAVHYPPACLPPVLRRSLSSSAPTCASWTSPWIVGAVTLLILGRSGGCFAVIIVMFVMNTLLPLL